MAFIEETGDLFDPKYVAIGHGVNVDGVMGAGIATVFRAKYPDMYDTYAYMCKAGNLRPGDMLPYLHTDNRWVFNIASQDRPGSNAALPWLAEGLTLSMGVARTLQLPHLAIPQIGCGIGGLELSDVKIVCEVIAALVPDVDLIMVTLP